jgi:hypothetical protein
MLERQDFLRICWTPADEITYPRYSTESLANLHFFGFNLSLAFLIRVRRFRLYSVRVRPNTRTSSR